MQTFSSIPISQIRPPRYRLRKDLGELEDLKKSISELGLLNPLIIRPVEGHYEVVAGHRRYVCIIELGWKELNEHQFKVVDISDKQAYELAIIENIDRKDMDPTEEAVAFKQYIMEYGFGSGLELATAIHRTPQYVSRRIELLRLPEENLMAVKNLGLSAEHAYEIARLAGTDNEKLNSITNEVADKGLTSMQTRKVVNLVKHGYDVPDAIQRTLDFPELGAPNESDNYDPVEDSREQMALAVGKALTQIDYSLEHMPDGEEKKLWIESIRFPMHELKSKILFLRKEFHPKDIWA